MPNTLGMDTIKQLLKEAEPKVKNMLEGKSYKESWPGERNRLKLAKAVANGDRFVMFGNDRFGITYDESNVLIRPSVGFVPMGFFSRSELKTAIDTVPDLDNAN